MTDTKDLPGTTETDATKWADAFARTHPQAHALVGEGTMLAWFANSIMAGWDAAMNRAANRPPAIDADHIDRQRLWSSNTFGPGDRHEGVRDHILKEIDEAVSDPSEWVDVIILALDGAWRAGMKPQDIIDGVIAKQTRNERRTWPDWRDQPQDKAIEHDRSVGDD